MSQDFLYCNVDGCDRRKARSVIEGSITAQPLQARSYPVLLAEGEWWAYRDLGVEVERVYCPAHHSDAIRIEGGEAE
jgi:hypothetical protein